MRKLAAWCHDRRRTVLGLWVGAFVLLGVLWGVGAGDFVNNFRLPGTESQRAYDLLKERFPQQAGDTANVVFAVKDGGVLDAGNRPEIERVREEIAKSPQVLAVGDPFAKGTPVSPDAKITFAQIQFRGSGGDVDVKQVKTMAENTLALDGKGGVQVALGGDIIHWSTAETGGAGEIFGILVAALVLFLTLGVVAMGLPLLNALFAMVVSLALMAIFGTRILDVVDWTPQLAAMIGIGVGIDYALLILNRFRLERGAGRDTREATLIALDTSGRAVLFAGIVVVIAMLGMMLLGISFLYGPAIGAALSVLATMVAALTLMPAILGSRIGRRIKKSKEHSADE
ncbi:MAG TPA: MMPL family transporter, partial [Solirubrobacter sp.]|nr:MMPL family transporter [Solirubrobacter sp.]